MKMNRRKFMKMACVGTCGAAIHNILRPTGDILAFADGPGTAASTAGSLTLVVLNLFGGCSYNIANPTNSLWLGQNQGASYAAGTGAGFGIPLPDASNQVNQVLHPALTAFGQMFAAGDLGVLNLVGYPNLNRSHDQATKIQHVGDPLNYNAKAGWGEVATCVLGGLYSGISLDGAATFTQGSCTTGGAFTSLNSLQNTQNGFWMESSQGQQFMKDIQKNVMISSAPLPGASAQYVAGQMDGYDEIVKTVAQATNITLTANFPGTGLGQQLKNAAKLIRSTLPVRVIFCGQGGYDTHSDEGNRQNQLFGELNGAVSAFYQEMQTAGRWNDVILLTMSEFSRICALNGSNGTDHGGSALQLVAGGRVNGGILSPTPTAADITAANNGNGYFENFHIHFLDPFSQILAALGVDPTPIFPAFGHNPNLHLIT